MASRDSVELEPLRKTTEEDEFIPVVSPAAAAARSGDGAAPEDGPNEKKITAKHHRRNSTVQEQRALRAKALEAEQMLSMPKVQLGRYMHQSVTLYTS